MRHAIVETRTSLSVLVFPAPVTSRACSYTFVYIISGKVSQRGEAHLLDSYGAFFHVVYIVGTS